MCTSPPSALKDSTANTRRDPEVFEPYIRNATPADVDAIAKYFEGTNEGTFPTSDSIQNKPLNHNHIKVILVINAVVMGVCEANFSLEENIRDKSKWMEVTVSVHSNLRDSGAVHALLDCVASIANDEYRQSGLFIVIPERDSLVVSMLKNCDFDILDNHKLGSEVEVLIHEFK